MQLILLWLGRRALELGGLAGTLLAFWNSLPPSTQDIVLSLLSRKWSEITLGALIPIAIALWGYVWSFISTTRTQVVVDGKQTTLNPNGSAAATVEKIAKEAPKRKTAIDHLRDLFNR